YAIDWQVGGAAWWFHAVNVAWHAGASVAVAWLARLWSGERAALAAGLLFAVHPVHVEAVANIVGRAEVMAGLFAILAVYAALADVARLLVFPLTLRVDYSPAERTLVPTLLDYRFALGVLCIAAWGGLLWLTWRRGRRVEAFGLGWIAIALFPVSNLVVPVGVLLAERALYLPSAGLVLAAGAWLKDLETRRLAVVLR